MPNETIELSTVFDSQLNNIINEINNRTRELADELSKPNGTFGRINQAVNEEKQRLELLADNFTSQVTVIARKCKLTVYFRFLK